MKAEPSPPNAATVRRARAGTTQGPKPRVDRVRLGGFEKLDGQVHLHLATWRLLDVVPRNGLSDSLKDAGGS